MSNTGKTTYSSLRIFSDSDDPREIDDLLAIKRTRWTPKDSGAARANEKLIGKLRSIWSWESSTPPSSPPDEHVAVIVAKLEERREELAQVIARTWQADIVLSYGSDNGQGGVTLRPHLISRLARLSVGFSMDVALWEEDTDE